MMARAQTQPIVVVGRSVIIQPRRPNTEATVTNHAPMVPAKGEPISLSSITSAQKRPSCYLVTPYTEINRRIPIQLATVSLRVMIFVRIA